MHDESYGTTQGNIGFGVVIGGVLILIAAVSLGVLMLAGAGGRSSPKDIIPVPLADSSAFPSLLEETPSPGGGLGALPVSSAPRATMAVDSRTVSQTVEFTPTIPAVRRTTTPVFNSAPAPGAFEQERSPSPTGQPVKVTSSENTIKDEGGSKIAGEETPSWTPTRPATMPTRQPTPTAAPAPEPTATASPSPTKALEVLPKFSEPAELTFSEFYKGGDAKGLIFSDKLVALKDKRVIITGFMAPPLKPALDFFVLTRLPLALCPFCSSDADWPEDIVFVRMPAGQTIKPTSASLRVEGKLDIGTKADEATGFVSLVRIYAERVTVLK